MEIEVHVYKVLTLPVWPFILGYVIVGWCMCMAAYKHLNCRGADRWELLIWPVVTGMLWPIELLTSLFSILFCKNAVCKRLDRGEE